MRRSTAGSASSETTERLAASRPRSRSSAEPVEPVESATPALGAEAPGPDAPAGRGDGTRSTISVSSAPTRRPSAPVGRSRASPSSPKARPARLRRWLVVAGRGGPSAGTASRGGRHALRSEGTTGDPLDADPDEDVAHATGPRLGTLDRPQVREQRG